jgi:hypothetical protein
MMVTKHEVRPPTPNPKPPNTPTSPVNINHVTALAEHEIVMRQHVMRYFIWVCTDR